MDDKTFFTKPLEYSAIRIIKGIEKTKAINIASVDVIIEPSIGAKRPYFRFSGSQMLEAIKLKPYRLRDSRELDKIVITVTTSMPSSVIEGGISERKNILSFLETPITITLLQ
ncbi:MAG: hypothetical protein QXQ91_02115 [Nanopusillaceae archaeon]